MELMRREGLGAAAARLTRVGRIVRFLVARRFGGWHSVYCGIVCFGEASLSDWVTENRAIGWKEFPVMVMTNRSNVAEMTRKTASVRLSVNSLVIWLSAGIFCYLSSKKIYGRL